MSEDFDNVRRLRAAAEDVPPPPDDQEPAGRGGDGDDGRDGEYRLPEDCPVLPLGVDGDMYYLLDEMKQLREVKDERFTRLKIASLFGSKPDLLQQQNYFPRWSVDKSDPDKERLIITGWKPEEAAMALTSACARMGPWSPFKKLRGRGAWLGRDGQLILHCGDRVMIGPPLAEGPHGRVEWKSPGIIDGYVYPTAAPTQRPATTEQAPGNGKGSPGALALELLSTWNWRRGETDAMLLLGGIGAQMIGGALKVRPVIWMTGGFETGKSTAQDAVRWLHGDDGIISVSDTTAAGVWQKLKYDSLPVGLDEQEAEEDNRNNFKIVKLARQAATGGMVLRGGADHTGAEFVARSCFLFSSILMPPLLGQDRSRMIILELGRLQSQTGLKLTQRKMNELGQRIRRRLVDNWHRWAETFEVYRVALGEAGHKGRGADVFGTALACADLILHDHVPLAEDAKAWADRLAAPALAEMEGEVSDEMACWQHLIASVIDPYRQGGRKTVGEWLARAAGKARDSGGDFISAGQVAEANQVLQTFGLRLVDNAAVIKLYGSKAAAEAKGVAPPYLAVANSHPAVGQIFAGTHWAGKSGAQGVWVQALRRLDGVQVPPRPLWLSGGDGHEIRAASHRVTLVPLSAASAQGDGTSPDTGAQHVAAPEAGTAGPEATASGQAGLDFGSDEPMTPGEDNDDLPI